MSKFTSYDAELNIQFHKSMTKYFKKDIWVVTKAFNFYLESPDSGKQIFVPAGFLTDGASVPRLFWNMIPPWGQYGQAAVLHDWLCENSYCLESGFRKKLSRKEADDIFNEALLALDVPTWKRQVMVTAVKTYTKFFDNGTQLQESRMLKRTLELACLNRYYKNGTYELTDEQIKTATNEHLDNLHRLKS